MKVDDFIEDLNGLCEQYWDKYLVHRTTKINEKTHENGVVILFDDDTKETK